MNEDSVRVKMQQVYELIASDIASIRTGRATAGLVEDVVISAYGGTQKLQVKEIGTISAPDPQTIEIDPWDKSIIGEIRQGLMSANIGLNPDIDGEILRISLPPMTAEDRGKYVKLLSTKLESGKVMLRQIRGENMREVRELFEKKEISEDEKFRQEGRLQELTDEFVDKILEAGGKKEKEILGV